MGRKARRQVKKMKAKKNAGMNIDMPSKSCDDKKCPFHGDIKLHGKTFVGEIIKKNPNRTVNVEWSVSYYIPKFERYSKRRTRVKAHNPPCIEGEVGEKVTIIETKPISKTKKFVVVRVEK